MATSKSSMPPSTWAMRSSAPTMSAPASRASAAASPGANTATRTSLPVPEGRATVPRTIWSALRGSTPEAHDRARRSRRTWRWPGSSPASTRLGRGVMLGAVVPTGRVGVLLAVLRHDGSLVSGTPATGVAWACGGPAGRGGPGRVTARRCRAGGSDDLDAHRAGGAGDLEAGGLEVVGVEVGHLDLGDLRDLRLGDRAGDGLRAGSGTPCRGRRPA